MSRSIKGTMCALRRAQVAKGVGVARETLNHVCLCDGEWLLFTSTLGVVTAVSWPSQFGWRRGAGHGQKVSLRVRRLLEL